jgi:hypothetical protein
MWQSFTVARSEANEIQGFVYASAGKGAPDTLR